MLESDLKRYLIKSLRAQDGVGHRVEDKYAVGWPDLILIPDTGPVFFAEVKLVKGLKMICTDLQEHRLNDLRRKPHDGRYYCHAVLLGYSAKREALYIGEPGQSITTCRYVQRPIKLDSVNWEINHLLIKYHLDKQSRLNYSNSVEKQELR